MSIGKGVRILAALLFALAVPKSVVAQPAPPPTPPLSVPDIKVAAPPVLCADCDKPFDPSVHEALLKDLANNPYMAELRKALYVQDIVHQFQSKVHFDNCDFDNAVDYVFSLIEEADAHVKAAEAAKAAKADGAAQSAIRSAFFALGQALHTVQDFYAHTNYVELQAPKVTKITDLEIIAPWREAGRNRINQLRKEGLYSGYVFWGFPQNCPAGTPSHGELAKDSEKTKSGGKIIPHLRNTSQYRIAVYLAREASLQLMTDAFRRWPLLKEANGESVAFEIVLDRRGL